MPRGKPERVVSSMAVALSVLNSHPSIADRVKEFLDGMTLSTRVREMLRDLIDHVARNGLYD
jgi:hypothetical protein